MEESERISMSEDELAVFAQKLERWSRSLPEKERGFLQQMLADAADAANDEVSGYANLSSLEQDDASGYASGIPGLNSFIGTILGYAEGVNREEQSYSNMPFLKKDGDSQP